MWSIAIKIFNTRLYERQFLYLSPHRGGNWPWSAKWLHLFQKIYKERKCCYVFINYACRLWWVIQYCSNNNAIHNIFVNGGSSWGMLCERVFKKRQQWTKVLKRSMLLQRGSTKGEKHFKAQKINCQTQELVGQGSAKKVMTLFIRSTFDWNTGRYNLKK